MFNSIPKGFAPQKPIQAIPPSVLAFGSKQFLIQRKRDGQRHYVFNTIRDHIRIYTRTLNDVTDKFPRLVKELNDLYLPTATLFDGEIICDRRGKDDLRATNEVCRAKPFVARQAEARLPIKFMPFDTLYLDGQKTYTLPYEERWEHVLNWFSEDTERICVPEVVPDIITGRRKVDARGWEGLVLWLRYKPNVIRFDGIHARHGSYKWLPIREGDFIATGWVEGTGKHKGRMGALTIAEMRSQEEPTATDALMRRTNRQGGWKPEHRTTPVTVDIGTCGTGFSDLERTAAMKWKYPLVVQLQFKFQQPDTRALREPRFLRIHPDKTVKEMMR